MDDLRKLKDYFEKQQEKEFGNKAYIVSDPHYNISEDRRRRRRIMRKKIDYSYVFNEALKELCWKIEQELLEEKRACERREKEPVEYKRSDRRR
jgi:hypothetical protein